MNSYDCPHGMGKAAACVECMADGPVAPPELKLKADFWLNNARYESECGKCSSTIRIGDPIGKTSSHGWCCADCSEP